MNKKVLLAVGVAASVSTAASANFESFTHVVTNIDGFSQVQVFANFSHADNVFLNIYNADISAAGGFNQSDFTNLTGGSGSWDQGQSADLPALGIDSALDSFVTGADSITLDPEFGAGVGTTIPVNAGWYNGNPNNAVTGNFAQISPIDPEDPFYDPSFVSSVYQVFVGQFVVASDVLDTFSFTASIGYKENADTTTTLFGGGTSSESFVIPAPGALALLGLGGLMARRRRMG